MDDLLYVQRDLPQKIDDQERELAKLIDAQQLRYDRDHQEKEEKAREAELKRKAASEAKYQKNKRAALERANQPLSRVNSAPLGARRYISTGHLLPGHLSASTSASPASMRSAPNTFRDTYEGRSNSLNPSPAPRRPPSA